MMKIHYVAKRLIAWACVIGLAVASWTPGQEMVRTGFNTRLEHTTAYLMAGIAVLAAYPQKPPWLIAVLLGVYADVLAGPDVRSGPSCRGARLAGEFRRSGLRLRHGIPSSESNALS
jgi:hypothetical protein